MTFARLALLVVLGCGGKPAPVVEAPKPAAPLELTFQTFAEAGSSQRPVAMGSTLKSGDKIALSVTVTQPAYIYVVQRFPDGKAGVLFPRPNEDRPITGTQRIPGTGWFELDQVVGEEHVYVVASTKPLAQADAKVKRTIDDVRDGHASLPGGEPKRISMGSGSADVKGSDGDGTATSKADGLLATRGLTRVESDNSIHATADDQGVAVFHFSFSHVAR